MFHGGRHRGRQDRAQQQGLGLAITGLVSAGDDWARLARPFHMRSHESCVRPISLAVSVVTDEPRSCSTNYFIGRAGEGLVNIEAAPDATCRFVPANGLLAHTNHFLVPESLGIAVPPNPHWRAPCIVCGACRSVERRVPTRSAR